MIQPFHALFVSLEQCHVKPGKEGRQTQIHLEIRKTLNTRKPMCSSKIDAITQAVKGQGLFAYK